MSLQLNEWCNSDGMYEMMEGKDNHSHHIVFPYIEVYVRKGTGCTDDGELTTGRSFRLCLLSEYTKFVGVVKDIL